LCGFAITLFSVDAAANINEERAEAEQARLLLTARLQEQAVKLQETVDLRTRELSQTNASLRAAADSNALLALVAQNNTSGVMITDASGGVEWLNAAFTRMTGYTLADLKGRHSGPILQGRNTDPAAAARLREAEHRGDPIQVDLLNYTKAGVAFWQSIDMQPVRDKEGRVAHFVSHHLDITQQRAAQLHLAHLHERLELATRAAALGVWEWDAITRRNTWDARTLEIYGLRPDQFKGTIEEWKEHIHPDDRATAAGKVQSILAGGHTYEHKFRIIRSSDGAERYLESRAIVQRDGQGNLLRITGTERDITAEHEAMHHAQTLNERLRLALRSSQFGVWEYDFIANRRIWDDRMMEIYGIPLDNFDRVAPQWEQYIHPEDREATVSSLKKLISGELSDYTARFRILRHDGDLRHIKSHGYLQRDAHGRPIRVVGLTRDVTEETQLEQALDLAEQRWQLAIEGTNDSVWDWDVVTGQVYHDDRWARMLGYEPGELDTTNAGWKSLAHPDDLAANEAAVREHFDQRTPFYQHELRMRARNGDWRWILDRGRVVHRATDGRPLRMAGTHTDITARKRLEERLRKTEQLANEVSRLAQIGGWEVDLHASSVTWTEGTRRIHEVDDTFQPTIESVWQFFPPNALTTVQTALRDATPARPSFDIEVPLLSARGRRVQVRILGHGEFRHGKAVSVHGAIQDITARHESEEARRELEAQLFQAQKMETLGTLAGGIAHDFNNLLTGIIGYHELAADSLPEDHSARMCLNEARNASLRARELVEQILTFGRHSGGGEHGPIDLSLVIEEARRFLRATLPANITIDTQLASHCGSVNADATQIHQVLLNLGSNAAHAMRHHGGALRITLEPAEVTPDLALTLGGPPADSYLRLSVTDTGHGMDESTRRRIFDPFFTTKNTREGTGLGLAVVHGIVRSHRGAIDVESAPGNGSSFHVYLPIASGDNPPPDLDPDVAPRGRGEYVCVVDDEDVVASCTKLVLENKGYRTLVYGSAEHCLEEMRSDPTQCAVLITDQTMPGMQGTELAAALRKVSPTLPIVIMSGYFSKISSQALDELGQVELLAKPFTTDELAHAIYRALHPKPATP
ncbi:MAG: PAS domain-containing protein, partial [Verrucomicrobiota bacterium]